jgi:hypothetical protein
MKMLKQVHSACIHHKHSHKAGMEELSGLVDSIKDLLPSVGPGRASTSRMQYFTHPRVQTIQGLDTVMALLQKLGVDSLLKLDVVVSCGVPSPATLTKMNSLISKTLISI